VHSRELERRLKEFSAGWAIQPHDEVFEEDDERRRFKAAVINWLAEHEAAMMEEIIYHAVGFTRATRSLMVSWAREIPFSQAMGQHTVRTLRRRGEQAAAEVGISEFLQALNVDWET
jgi:hypothetical protein